MKEIKKSASIKSKVKGKETPFKVDLDYSEEYDSFNIKVKKGEGFMSYTDSLQGLPLEVVQKLNEMLEEVLIKAGSETEMKEHKMSNGGDFQSGVYAKGGEIRKFDRHSQMDSETREEILDVVSEPELSGYLTNCIYGLFDGYDYSQTDNFKKDLNKLKSKDSKLYNRVVNIYKKIDTYKFENRNEYAKGGGVTLNTEVILYENRPNGAVWQGVVKPFMLESIEENQYAGGFKRYEIDIYDEVKREPTKEEIKQANEFFDKIGGRYANGGGVGLIGNQKRIDLNKNGKIDAEDFKLLRTTMNGGWRKDHKYVNSSNPKEDYEVIYARKYKPSRKGYKGKTNFATGGGVDRFSEYSNDALYDMIINLSRYENTESEIQMVKEELEKRKANKKMATGGGIGIQQEIDLTDDKKLRLRKPVMPERKYSEREWAEKFNPRAYEFMGKRKMANGGDLITETADAIFYANVKNGKIKTSFGDKTKEGLLNMLTNVNYDRSEIVDAIFDSNEKNGKINTGFGAKTKEGLSQMIKNMQNTFANGGGVDYEYDGIAYAKTKALQSIDWDKELREYAGSEYSKLTTREKEEIISDMQRDWNSRHSFATGGDLFENYEKQPKELAKIVDFYMDKFNEGDYDYEDSQNFLKEVEAIGYTFDFGLDNEPYNLRPLKKMANGGGVGAYYIVTFGFNGDEGYQVVNSKPIFAKSENEAELLLKEQFESYEGVSCDIISTKKQLANGGGISKFKKLSDKVAKNYEGKRVKPQYQKEYGKVYSKDEAKEVGDKVAGKVKANQKMATGGQTKKGGQGGIMVLAKQIRKDGESWKDALKRAGQQLK